MAAEPGRRLRRFGRSHNQTILPLRSSQYLSNTLSCWYCDLKISSLNEPLHRFGQLYASFLRLWFTVGIGFTLSALLGVTMILIIKSACLFYHGGRSNKLDDLLSTLLFGFSPSVLGFRLSLIDVACLVISTVISVAIHEFGHASAATCEGIRVEYIAVFIAVLFPGALVAFDDDLLRAKPRKTSLSIYCAGIWHNAVIWYCVAENVFFMLGKCCAACGFMLLLLPFIFSPFYIRCESPMVLDVFPDSPIYGYLPHGGHIVSLDGLKIRNSQEWTHLATLIHKQTWHNGPVDLNASIVYPMINYRRGYCAPSSLIHKSKKASNVITSSPCPDDLTAFTIVHCSSSNVHKDGVGFPEHRIDDSVVCLNASDVVRFKRCGELGEITDYGSNCLCSKNESCLSPVLSPGVSWAEVTYQTPYSKGSCSGREKSISTGFESSESDETCEKTFLFVGDMSSMAESVQLTEYQPRLYFPFGSYLPFMVEKILMCTFHVSLTLALLNSLPVYFLDGEYILEVCLCYLTVLSPKTRRILLRACLAIGSVLTCVVFLGNITLRLWLDLKGVMFG